MLPLIIKQITLGAWISAILMALLAVYIWAKGYYLKKGVNI